MDDGYSGAYSEPQWADWKDRNPPLPEKSYDVAQVLGNGNPVKIHSWQGEAYYRAGSGPYSTGSLDVAGKLVLIGTSPLGIQSEIQKAPACLGNITLWQMNYTPLLAKDFQMLTVRAITDGCSMEPDPRVDWILTSIQYSRRIGVTASRGEEPWRT